MWDYIAILYIPLPFNIRDILLNGDIELIFSTSYHKEEVNTKSYVTTSKKETWYIL